MVEDSNPGKASLSRGSILLFHGLTSSPAELDSLSRVLLDHRFKVTTPPLAGHGDIEQLRRTSLDTWLSEAEKTLAETPPGGPFFVGGCSFGALLSLYLGTREQRPIDGLVLLAPPFKLRRRFDETRLRLLSKLPEHLIDTLGVRKKNRARESRLVFPRNCLEAHSVASIVRMAKLRNLIAPRIPTLRVPVLIIQDPHDHLVHPDGVDPFIESAEHSEIDTIWLPGAEHELTLGPRHLEVSRAVLEFLNRICLAN
ncbi:MAG: hypothetical protein RL417_2181 [Pseudomonadota bacterium]|jgi:esterase/lipase